MSKEQAKQKVVKVTLSSGKIVLLNEMKISTSEKAAEMVAQRAGDSQNLMIMLMPKALLQLLLYKVDDKDIGMNERNNMDSLFSVVEYNQLLKVVGKMNGGGEEKGEAQVEFLAGS